MRRFLIHKLVDCSYHPAALDTATMQGVKLWKVFMPDGNTCQLFADVSPGVTIGDTLAALGLVDLPGDGATEVPYTADVPVFP